jgi:hypothetical protein
MIVEVFFAVRLDRLVEVEFGWPDIDYEGFIPISKDFHCQIEYSYEMTFSC